jgi:hypothetical protein
MFASQVTVAQLIKELSSAPPNAVVYFYCDGTRYEADVTSPIDLSFVDDHEFVDINLVP